MTGLRTAMMSGPAGRWVRLVWEWPGYRSAAAAERILPHGLAELTWDLTGPMAFDHGGHRRRHAGPVIIGPHTSAYVVDTGRPQHLFGILFAPGTAAAFLGCSASDLLDQTEPWGDFHAAPGLGQQLADAPDWPTRRAIVREHFASLEGPVLPVGARRLLQVWREDPSASVRSVAALAGISAPTLARHTRRAFGMAPAQLRRVWRFRRSVELWSGGHESSLAGLAHAAGYADQAHLTREFGAFAGITPGRYAPLLEGHAFNVAADDVHFVQD